MLFFLGRFTRDYKSPIWGPKKQFLYNFQNFCIQNTNDYPKVHFGLPIFSEVPKTTHMLSDSLERLTGFYIYTYIFFNSQLQFITVKGYSTGSAKKKNTGEVWTNPFTGFLCALPLMSGHNGHAPFPTSKKRYMCNVSAQGDLAPSFPLGLVMQPPSVWQLAKFQTPRIKQVFTINYSACTI